MNPPFVELFFASCNYFAGISNTVWDTLLCTGSGIVLMDLYLLVNWRLYAAEVPEEGRKGKSE